MEKLLCCWSGWNLLPNLETIMHFHLDEVNVNVVIQHYSSEFITSNVKSNSQKHINFAMRYGQSKLEGQWNYRLQKYGCKDTNKD
jgi:ribosome-associated toxin RatA of RatAB toxin-antitoxin module